MEQFVKLGGEIVAEERYGSDVTDFRSQLTKIVNANQTRSMSPPRRNFPAARWSSRSASLDTKGESIRKSWPVGATALEVAGEAATGVKAIIAELNPANAKSQEVLSNFRARYNYVTLPWYLASGYDDVYITAECLKMTGDDQDADGFRDCLYGITWSGAIGENYSFDSNGEVVGLANTVVEVLPESERTEDNNGYRILGPAPGAEAAAAAAAMSQEPFRIGAMDALTGPAETYGIPLNQAKQLAVEEINAAGGING